MSGTANSATVFKVYPTAKAGRTYHLVRFKGPEGWRSKFAPAALTTEDAVNEWVVSTFLPSIGLSPKVCGKTITDISDAWLRYREKDPQFTHFKGTLTNWILPHPIARKDVETLEPKDCRAFIRSIDRAPYTVRNVVATVRTLIDDARSEGWISWRATNLFRDKIVSSALPAGVKLSGEDNVSLSVEQVQSLLDADSGLAQERLTRYTVAIATGMRDGEINGLQWQDIDWQGATVKVDRQLGRGSLNLKPPKKNSYRTLPVHPLALERLKSWSKIVPSPPTLPIFPNSKGHHWHPNSSRFLKDDLGRLGLPVVYDGLGGVKLPFTFHALRRTFASLLDAQNVDRGKIGALLGHKAQGVSARHYLAKNLEICRGSINRLPLQRQ